MSISYDISSLGDNPETEVIHKFLRKQIKAHFSGVEKAYLLQCAYWAPHRHYSDSWAAYSPISSWSGDWPLYGIDGIEFADETDITFSSWKGDYENERKRYNPFGNLKKDHENDHFKGELWTRGF